MRKSKVFPFLIVAMVVAFFGLIIGLAAPFYKSRTVSTNYYAGKGHTSKGDWSYFSIAESNPGLMVFLILSTIFLIIACIIVIVSLRNASSKAPGFVLMVAVALAIVAGVTTFISQFTMSSSSTSGMAGLWSSHGESVELSSGIAYIIFSILAQAIASVGGVNYMKYVDEGGGYVPSSHTHTSSTASKATINSALARKTITFPSDSADDMRYTVYFFDKYILIKGDYVRVKMSVTYKTNYEDIRNTDLLVGDKTAFLTINSNSIAHQIDDGLTTNERRVIISIKNIDNGSFNSKEVLTNIEKDIKDKCSEAKAKSETSVAFPTVEDEKTKKVQAFLDDFKKEYGADFETFKSCFKNTFCQTEMNTLSGTRLLIYLYKNKKLFFIAREEEYNPTVKLLVTPKASFNDDEYKAFLSATRVSEFKKIIFGYEDIVDIRFVSDKQSISMNTRQAPSGLKLALEAEFIHPMYAVGDALQGANPITTEFDFSKYELVFEKNPYKHVYVIKDVFNCSDELKDIAHDMQVRRAKALEAQPAPAQPVAAPKTKMERLKELKELLDNNLITQEEYDSARAEILKD